MCGIIGFIGNGNGVSSVIDGLEKLEYRGYDSAGIAFLNNQNIMTTVKAVGHVEALTQKVHNANLPQDCSICIGHTRWATHGGVSELNAHPHLSNNQRFAVVHNGIIENYLELIEFLKSKGLIMHSQTDTEVIPNLLQYYSKQESDLKIIVQKTLKHLKGSFAIVVMDSLSPDTLICAKHHMPLNVACTETFTYITSDIPTALTKSKTVYVMDDDETAIITSIGVQFLKNDTAVTKAPIEQTNNNELITKLNYTTYMEKEINDIPIVFENLISHYRKNPINKRILKLMDEARTVHIAACGTAYHAGLTLGCLLERYCGVRTKVHIASEFRYARPLLFDSDIGIIISQSGETADSIAAMRLIKEQALPVISICNTANSTIAQHADFNMPTMAGFEIAVASTKAYCAQVLLAAIIANELHLFQHNKPLYEASDFAPLPILAREVIALHEQIKAYAEHHKNVARIFFLGKDMDYFASMESALKVKEITYLQCEGYAAGELKHGTLSLVDKDTLTIVYQTDKELAPKTANAAEEVRARGSKILTIGTEAKKCSLAIPNSPLLFAYSVIPAQLFALRLAQLKNLNPDKPRNLAKSVTVE